MNCSCLFFHSFHIIIRFRAGCLLGGAVFSLLAPLECCSFPSSSLFGWCCCQSSCWVALLSPSTCEGGAAFTFSQGRRRRHHRPKEGGEGPFRPPLHTTTTHTKGAGGRDQRWVSTKEGTIHPPMRSPHTIPIHHTTSIIPLRHRIALHCAPPHITSHITQDTVLYMSFVLPFWTNILHDMTLLCQNELPSVH